MWRARSWFYLKESGMDTRECVIYWRKEEPNEAVVYYVGIMYKALCKHFSRVRYTHDIETIGKSDVVVTISIMSFLSVWKRNKKQELIYWWQGVCPEEINFGKEKLTLRDRLKYRYYSLLERLCLRRSKMNLFVSEAMVSHYARKYGFKKRNYVVMPCYNQTLDEKAFCAPGKYSRPSFVYAGGMFAWQCVDEALQLYGLVKEKYPEATMSLLTRDKDVAQAMVEKHGLRDVAIKFVPLEKLNEELAQYKYGMLLRAESPVNYVATPTKFNSYLASGIIPVISRVIGDYGGITDKMRYAVCVRDEKDIQAAFEKIDSLEREQISADDVLAEYKRIFASYYNEAVYIDRIVAKLQETYPANR